LTLTGRALPQLHSRCARVRAAFASTMKTDKGKTVKKENLPSKICAVCGRPFTWCVDPACHASVSKVQALVLTELCHVGANANCNFDINDLMMMLPGFRRKKWESCWDDVK